MLGLSSGETLGQSLQGRLAGALVPVPALPATRLPDGLDDPLVVHPAGGCAQVTTQSRATRVAPYPHPADRGGDGDRGQLPDRWMCGDGPPGEPVG
jgi:hypothetical protein